MAPVVEKIIENIQFGEGPHWDEETQSLYFIDVRDTAIHRYVPATKKHTKAALGTDHVGLIIPIKGQKNQFLVPLKSKIARVTWDGESDKPSKVEIILDNTNSDSAGTQFNDGKCDPTGRLWIGTMFATDQDISAGIPTTSNFYSLEGNKLKKHLSKLGISNGVAFNTDLKKMYYIDSVTNSVDVFDFDIKNGTIENRKHVFTFKKHNIPGNPDGAAIDTDGNLWVAAMRGSRVVKIDPRKPETLLDVVVLPTKIVTSVAFGGKNLDELYVTTGKPWDSEPTAHDGCIYRITGLNAKGLPGIPVAFYFK